MPDPWPWNAFKQKTSAAWRCDVAIPEGPHPLNPKWVKTEQAQELNQQGTKTHSLQGSRPMLRPTQACGAAKSLQLFLVGFTASREENAHLMPAAGCSLLAKPVCFAM